jgi:hypothetical protein
MNNDWSLEALAETMLLPSKRLLIKLICRIVMIGDNSRLFDLIMISDLLISSICHVKSDGCLKVQLNGAALMRSVESIEESDVNLWSIKGSISRVLFPRHSELIQTFLQLLFRSVPKTRLSHVVLWPCGKIELKFKAKNLVDVLHKVKSIIDLLFDLIRSAEYMSIILTEPPYSSQSGESSCQLISMQNSKVCKSNREIFVTSWLRLVEQIVPRTVHRLNSIPTAFILEHKHVLCILVIMPTHFP